MHFTCGMSKALSIHQHDLFHTEIQNQLIISGFFLMHSLFDLSAILFKEDLKTLK